MRLSDLDVKHSYITYGEDNVRDALIIPALKIAKSYKRSVGFFSTSVFDTILDGVVELVKNGGTIQIISSPKLNQEDVDAINIGYSVREQIIVGAFLRDFEDSIDKLDDYKLQLVAQLIANGVLDIRITDLNNEEPEVSGDGDYHDKLGIITDAYGDSIVFVGSPNETINGYKKNYEKVRVFESWVPVAKEYAQDEISEFDALWEGTNPYLKTYKFKDALREKVIEVQNHRNYIKKTEPIKLTDYQNEAIDAWVKNNYHGFYVMATGTGKTWTAIYSAVELQKKHDCLIVICAPYKHLVRQWADDLEKAFPGAAIVMVSSDNTDWESDLTKEIVRERQEHDRMIIVVSTISSFYLDRFKNTIKKSSQDKLLIVDEAHRFTQRPESLHEDYKYMLGLSATPFSGKDSEKGNELIKFFGGQVYNLPIEDAFKNNFLVPYYYYPIYVHATPEEEKKFKEISSKIGACFDKNHVCIDSDGLIRYTSARLRIISMAQEKMDYLDNIIDQIKERDHFIVYCGDGRLYDDNNNELRHINFVKQKLDSHGFKASQFTASEKMDTRMELINAFNEGEIDVLTAIRCLDEGINIPSIEGALILSSNDNYREFVQRRGRILRKYKNKKYANIYDVIVLPSEDTPKWAEIELRRFYEYARLAINADEKLSELKELASVYGLDIENLVTDYEIQEEYKEAPLDE